MLKGNELLELFCQNVKRQNARNQDKWHLNCSRLETKICLKTNSLWLISGHLPSRMKKKEEKRLTIGSGDQTMKKRKNFSFWISHHLNTQQTMLHRAMLDLSTNALVKIYLHKEHWWRERESKRDDVINYTSVIILIDKRKEVLFDCFQSERWRRFISIKQQQQQQQKRQKTWTCSRSVQLDWLNFEM